MMCLLCSIIQYSNLPPDPYNVACTPQMVESRFRELLYHSALLLRKKWLFGVLDDFITKQLPHNVTWGLSLLYALEHKGDRALSSTQGDNINLIFIYFI